MSSSSITLLSFIPPELTPLLIVASGFAIMFGAKKVAASLFTLAICIIVLPPLLDPLISQLPGWALLLLFMGVIVSVILAILRLTLGRRETEGMISILAADIVRGIFLFPFRVIRYLFFRR